MITVLGILLPFFGTAIGSAGVFFMKNNLADNTQRALLGFAGGVMTAASVWSLLIPSMEKWQGNSHFSFIPAVVGFWIGVLFLLFLDKAIPHLHRNALEHEGPEKNFKKTTMLVLAVVLHNIPEGMAVGAVFAGALSGDISPACAFSLSFGIAIQNFPEGAIISMPLNAEKISRPRSFAYGVLSGAVEPAAALITVILSSYLVPVLPYCLSFAAGAMIFVTVEELIPEMSQGKHKDIGNLMFCIGFTVMLMLDVALG